MGKKYRQNKAAAIELEQQQYTSSITALANRYQVLWGITGLIRFSSVQPSPELPRVLDYLGILAYILAGYSQLRIYQPYFREVFSNTKQPRKLLTDGFFRYTRHPMYTFLVIGDVIHRLLYQQPTGTVIMTAIGFYGATVITCYMHEREVLARFGREAEDYYTKTPRLFLLYPFYNSIR